ncbi:MAG: hypothetical protein ABSA52_06460 [Candidatus Binatia bacterium]|jgi:hypothetical protein
MAHHYFRIVILGLALAASGVMPGVARAGCKTDCEDDYDSAKSDCVLLHDDPDEADDLRACIDDARSDYEDCEDECNS